MYLLSWSEILSLEVVFITIKHNKYAWEISYSTL